MSPKKNVVVHFAKKFAAVILVGSADNGVPGVADELALGHLVLDMGRPQVHGQQDQRKAKNVDGI